MSRARLSHRYTQGFDAKTKGVASSDDIKNVFEAFGGDSRDEKSKVSAETMASTILEQYGLEFSVGDTFGKEYKNKDELTKDDIAALMTKGKEA